MRFLPVVGVIVAGLRRAADDLTENCGAQLPRIEMEKSLRR